MAFLKQSDYENNISKVPAAGQNLCDVVFHDYN